MQRRSMRQAIVAGGLKSAAKKMSPIERSCHVIIFVSQSFVPPLIPRILLVSVRFCASLRNLPLPTLHSLLFSVFMFPRSHLLSKTPSPPAPRTHVGDECLLHVVPVNGACDYSVLFALSNGATKGTFPNRVVWRRSRLREVLPQL